MRAESHPEDYGTVTAPGTVRIERLLPGPIERIWTYLTDSGKRCLWMASGSIELRVGGRVENIFCNDDFGGGETPPLKYAQFAGEVRNVGRILEYSPPRLLAYTWNEGTGDPSEVRFELVPRGDKVLLVITHRQLADRDLMVSVAAGWHAHLDILRDLLGDRPIGQYWSTHMRLEAEYEPLIPAG